jgi:hypothetical protein
LLVTDNGRPGIANFFHSVEAVTVSTPTFVTPAQMVWFSQDEAWYD